MTERLKKLLMGVAALAALALGGAAIAGAAGGQSTGADRPDSSGEKSNEGFESSADDRAEKGDKGENESGGDREQEGDHQTGDNDRGDANKGENDSAELVRGSEADRATAAALKATGGGRANAVERDSENGATWEVEVTKPDGKTVDVRLDENYKVVVIEGDSESG